MSFQIDLTAALLNHLFGKSTYTPPTMYIGLSTSSGTVVEVSESGTGYARQATTANDWDFADITGNAFTANNATINFPVATAYWGTIQQALLCDALTGGTVLARADAAIDKTISTGDSIIILPGKLKFILL